MSILVGGDDETVGFTVLDQGSGICWKDQQLQSPFRFFHSTTVVDEPTYTFSGNFGGSLEVWIEDPSLCAIQTA